MSRLNNLFIFLLSLYALLWGTAWNIKYINLNITELFLPLILFYSLIKIYIDQKSPFTSNNLIFFFIVSFIITVYLGIGLIEINNLSNTSSDIFYAISYYIKIIIFFFFSYLISSILDSEENIEKFIKYFFLMLIPLYFFLHYRYAFIYETYHVGVSLDGLGLKNGKNSFGGMIALLAPFILSSLFKENRNNLFIFLSTTVILLSSYFIYSRAMAIVVAIEIAVIIFLLDRGIKKILIMSLIFLSFFLIYKNYEEDVLKYFLKSDYESFQDDKLYNIEDIENEYKKEYLFFDTHRGWLLYEAVQGAKDNNFIGSGIGTFRVRLTNLGNRTETHNDIALIFYEIGMIGLSIFIVSISVCLIKSYKVFKSSRNYLYRAIIASLVGLVSLMLFSNFISTFMFWLIIGLYISLIKARQKKLDLKSE